MNKVLRTVYCSDCTCFLYIHSHSVQYKHNISLLYSLKSIISNSGTQLNIHILHTARCSRRMIPLPLSVISVFMTLDWLKIIFITVKIVFYKNK